MTRLLSQRVFSPAAIVLLLVTAMVGGGLDIRPTPAAGCSITSEDPEPQPCDASADASAEDEEGESAKHAAVGSSIVLDWSAGCDGTLADFPALIAVGPHRGTAPIRGPPARA